LAFRRLDTQQLAVAVVVSVQTLVTVRVMEMWEALVVVEAQILAEQEPAVY
jgi:hypothetical protein